MFEDDVIKLKKEQFIEAESVAYLIKDEMKRKLAFANTCCLFAFKNYVEKNKYKYEPITNINLFRVPIIAEKYGISDLYLGNIRIDVRVSLDGNVFPVPKSHIQNSLAADYYVVYKGTKNPLKCEGLGYIRKEDLVFDSQDENYYYISVAILNPLEELKEEINIFVKEEKTLYETEHRLAKENIGAFLDGELDEVKSLDMLEHMLNCTECRGLFVEYSFLEDVLTSVEYYPDLKEDLESYMAKNELENDNIVNESNIEQEMIIEEEAEDDILSINEDDTIMNTDANELSGLAADTDVVETIETVEAVGEAGAVAFDAGAAVDMQGIDAVSETLDIVEDIIPFELDEKSENIEIETSNDETNVYEIKNTETEISEEVYKEEGSSIGLEYEEDVKIEEPEEDISDDIAPKISVPEIENVDTNDEYSITESEEIVDDLSIDSDDIELKNFIMDDINEDSMNIDNVSENKITENEQQELYEEPVAFENNINDEPISQNNNLPETFDNGNEETVNFEDIFSNNEEIEISSNEVENMKNDEELNNILNDTNNTENIVQSPSSEWNELFKEDSNEIQNKDNSEYQDNTVTEFNQDTNDIEEIGTLYETQNNTAEENDNIEQKIEQETINEKKPVNTAIFAGLIVVILAIVAVGGFIYMGSNLADKFKNNNNLSDNTYADGSDYSNGDMNKVLTDAFSDGEDITAAKLEITKMSWDKNKSSKMTNELKEYLNASASSIWDNLDESLSSVQGYEVSAPSKIVISVNKSGEVNNVKIAQSCGSKEVDSLILESVKNVLTKMTPASYSVKGENINLTLVVNF